MAERTSFVGDGLFYVLMSFVLAAAFGAGIGFAYGGLLEHGWSGGFMVGALVAAVVGLLLSGMVGRKLPPPNTLKAPVAPEGGLHRAPEGGAHSVPGGSGSGSWTPSRSSTESGSEVSETVDRVAAAAGGIASSISERFGEVADRVTGKVSGAGGSAGQAIDEVSDTAKLVGELASDKMREARESAATAIAPESPDDGVNPRVRDAAREAGDVARGMETPQGEPAPSAEAGPEPQVAAVRPPALDAPRENRGDDLKKIKGVGFKIEAMLQGLGFWHFDQIAAWTDAELAWVDQHLDGFNGRASRDEWVAQAKILAAGGETDFSDRVDKGAVYD